MGDRHDHAMWTACGFDLGIEMLGECHDKARAQAAFEGLCAAYRHSDAVVGDGELPIRTDDFVADDHLAILTVMGKCML